MDVFTHKTIVVTKSFWTHETCQMQHTVTSVGCLLKCSPEDTKAGPHQEGLKHWAWISPHVMCFDILNPDYFFKTKDFELLTIFKHFKGSMNHKDLIAELKIIQTFEYKTPIKFFYFDKKYLSICIKIFDTWFKRYLCPNTDMTAVHEVFRFILYYFGF